MVSSTLPELLDERQRSRSWTPACPRWPASEPAWPAPRALDAARADPARLREIARMRAARAALRRQPVGNGRRWLSEHEAKELLRVGAAPGRRRAARRRRGRRGCRALGARRSRGGEASAPSLQHKADIGAWCSTSRRRTPCGPPIAALPGCGVEGAGVLVERMAPPGAELLVAARADAVVPCLVVAAGGAGPSCSTTPRSCRSPPRPSASRGDPRPARRAAPHRRPRAAALDVAAAARLAAAAGELLARARARAARAQPRARPRAGRRGGGRGGAAAAR